MSPRHHELARGQEHILLLYGACASRLDVPTLVKKRHKRRVNNSVGHDDTKNKKTSVSAPFIRALIGFDTSHGPKTVRCPVRHSTAGETRLVVDVQIFTDGEITSETSTEKYSASKSRRDSPGVPMAVSSQHDSLGTSFLVLCCERRGASPAALCRRRRQGS